MGVGNVLLGDDALGPWMLRWMESRWQLPEGVTPFDAGTPGLDLTLFLDGFDAIVAVDAIAGSGAPGTVRTFRRADLLGRALPIVMSPHEPTLREALMRLDLFGRCPTEVFLIGAVPERVTTGTGLSAAVRGAVPAIEAQIVRELERLGARPVARAQPRPPDLWWEAPASAKLAPLPA